MTEVFWDEMFSDGTFHDGMLRDGTFCDGMLRNGTFSDGMFCIGTVWPAESPELLTILRGNEEVHLVLPLIRPHLGNTRILYSVFELDFLRLIRVMQIDLMQIRIKRLFSITFSLN